MLFSSSAVPASPVLTFRGGLRFEPLEARCLLSVSQPVDWAGAVVTEVETGGQTPGHFSLLAGSIVESQSEGASLEMAGASQLPGERPDRAIDGTLWPLTDAVTTEEVVLGPQLVAVPPDDSVDPFVDCPGLDEDFYLPDVSQPAATNCNSPQQPQASPGVTGPVTVTATAAGLEPRKATMEGMR